MQWSKSDEQAPSSFPIVQISGSDIHSQEKAKRVHEDMAFASFHALVRIEATDPGRFLNGFDALRIDDRCARLGISPDSLTFDFPKSRKQPKPGAEDREADENDKRRFERRGKFVGK